jgi:hypothetical protein
MFNAIAVLALIVGLIFGVMAAIDQMTEYQTVRDNWKDYRCQPLIMPFAAAYGFDTAENFQFCIQQIIQKNTKGVTGPFTSSMFGFTTILQNLMDSANSFRLTMATLVGGVVKIISEFKARMTALMGRVKLTASRMKTMMYRLYGTMFAVIYMGMSAQTGILNFGDTFIFKFIDTFCFPPEQIIELEYGEQVPISDIMVGDVLQGGHRVETIYQFAADGQDMVKLGNVEVSSNHFVK